HGRRLSRGADHRGVGGPARAGRREPRRDTARSVHRSSRGATEVTHAMRIRIRRVPAAVAVALAALAAPGLALGQGPCASRLPTEPITINLRDANVQTTLRLLAQQYRVNMIVTDEVKGTVTVDFFQVPARDAFQVVIDSAGLQCVEVGGVLRV